MRLLTYLITILEIVLFTFVSVGQTRPYVKFDSSGRPLGIFNLARPGTDCSTLTRMVGKVRSFRNSTRADRVLFMFTIEDGQALRRIVVSLDRDSIPEDDIKDLLTGGFRSQLAASVCRMNGKWVATEIRRS